MKMKGKKASRFEAFESFEKSSKENFMLKVS